MKITKLVLGRNINIIYPKFVLRELVFLTLFMAQETLCLFNFKACALLNSNAYRGFIRETISPLCFVLI